MCQRRVTLLSEGGEEAQKKKGRKKSITLAISFKLTHDWCVLDVDDGDVVVVACRLFFLHSLFPFSLFFLSFNSSSSVVVYFSLSLAFVVFLSFSLTYDSRREERRDRHFTHGIKAGTDRASDTDTQERKEKNCTRIQRTFQRCQRLKGEEEDEAKVIPHAK